MCQPLIEIFILQYKIQKADFPTWSLKYDVYDMLYNEFKHSYERVKEKLCTQWAGIIIKVSCVWFYDGTILNNYNFLFHFLSFALFALGFHIHRYRFFEKFNQFSPAIQRLYLNVKFVIRKYWKYNIHWVFNIHSYKKSTSVSKSLFHL